jgi:ElaB/YqjD/DUF883 family membrane-anchored ribosome-binding protein
MSDQKLRATVDEIRAELARAQGLSERTQHSLRQLADDLESLLDRPVGAARQEDESLRDRLADWVRELEASHPALSTTIGNVIDTLAFFGL